MANPNCTSDTKHIRPPASDSNPRACVQDLSLANLVISGLAHWAIPADGNKCSFYLTSAWANWSSGHKRSAEKILNIVDLIAITFLIRAVVSSNAYAGAAYK